MSDTECSLAGDDWCLPEERQGGPADRIGRSARRAPRFPPRGPRGSQPSVVAKRSQTRWAPMSSCTSARTEPASSPVTTPGAPAGTPASSSADTPAPQAPIALACRKHSCEQQHAPAGRAPARRARPALLSRAGSASAPGAGRAGEQHARRTRPTGRRRSVRCTAMPFGSVPPCGRDHQRHHAGRRRPRAAQRVHAVEVAVGVDDDADHPAVGGPGRRRPGTAPGSGRGRPAASVGVGGRQAQAGGHLRAQVRVDVGQRQELALLDRLLVALGELEGVGARRCAPARRRRHAQPELARLAVVVVERRGLRRAPSSPPATRDRHVDERAVVGAGEERAAAVERVRPVRRDAAVDGVLVEAVAEHVVDRRVRPVDRDLVEVRPAEPGQLGVEVGEQPRLQQRVVGDVDAGHQVADVEGDLLGLGEEVRRVARSASAARSACTGASSSGTSLVGSSRSMPSNVWSSVSGKTWTPSSHCG